MSCGTAIGSKSLQSPSTTVPCARSMLSAPPSLSARIASSSRPSASTPTITPDARRDGCSWCTSSVAFIAPASAPT
jgi:hypothetical protein